MRARSTAGTLWAVITVSGGLLLGCGGSSADEQRLQNDKLEAARVEGRRQANADNAAKAAAAQAKKLQREIDKLKKSKAKSSGSTTTGGQGSTAAPPTSPQAGSPCGGGVSAGNSVTTCPFSLNVADVYRGSDGAATIDVYSPVTKQTYIMSCSAGSPTVCRGGNNAVVYIR